MANHYIDLPVNFGVLSIDGMTGALTLVAGSGITIVDNPGAGTITISSTGLTTAITSINGDTTSAQTLSVGTSGTDFAIVDAGGGSHVFNLPTASAVNRGALSSADWTTFNNKQSLLSIGTYDSQTPSSDGLVLLSSVLYAQSASATVPGMVSTNPQSFAGEKLFIDTINADGGIDRSTSGTLTIGATNSTVINIGNSGATVNIQGTTIYENTPQLLVADPLITVNHGGGAGSGQNAGIQIEEASSITGYAETSADRNSWILKAPNTAGIATITPGVAGITLDQSSHNPVTIGSPANGLSVDGSQVVSLGLSSTSTTGALSNTDWNTFNSKQPAGSYITALTGDVTASGPGSAVASIASTTVTAKVLTGYTSGPNSVVLATDTILAAFGKLQAQVSGTSGAAITALTGDATATGPGSVPITLATVNTNTGSFGSSTAIPSFTVNGKGLITAASTNVVIAPAGTLTGTTLASNVVSSSLTSVGTITSGTWNGTTIAIANGGTGQTSANPAFNALSPLTTAGDLLTYTTVNARLGVGSNGNVLTVVGGAPAWQAPATSGTVTSVAMTVPTFLSVSGSPITSAGTLAVTLSGTALPVANGGTGQTSYTDGQLLIGNTTGNTLAKSTLTAGTGISITNGSGTISIATTGAPPTGAAGGDLGGTYPNPTVLSVANISTGTLGVNHGGTGAITLTSHGVLLGHGTSAVTATAAGSAGQVLQSGGASADPTYSTPTYPSASGSTGKILRSDGTNNLYSTATFPDTATTSDLLYASATNTWTSLAKSNTSALVSNSTGVPAWALGTTANRLLRTDGTSVTFAQAALATDVSGTLPVANGGTGTATAFTAGSVIFAGASGTYSQNNAKLFWDNTNANMGIGTSSPINNGAGFSTLTINGSTGGAMECATGGATVGQFFSTAGGFYVGSHNTYPLNLTTNDGTVRVTVLDTSGNVGVGITNPAHKMDILGTASFGLLKIIGNGAGAEGSIGFKASTVTDGNSGDWVLGANLVGPASGSFALYNGGTAGIAATFLTSGNLGLGTITPGEVLEVAGNVKSAHVVGRTSTPTFAAGTGAGTTPTITMSGTDMAGIINVTTGTGTSATSAILVTVTFNVAYGTAPFVVLSPHNALTARLAVASQVFTTSTTTTFVINTNTTGLALSSAYSWYYQVVQ